MEITCFVFLVEEFQFSKFHENEANHAKPNFTRDMAVAFEVKNS